MHHFLHRHVYGASKPYMSRGMSTAITFLISALLHELIMGCITKKLRGYGFVAMMLQIPLVTLQRSKFLRGKSLFNVSHISSDLFATLLISAERVLLDIDDFGSVYCESSPIY